MSTSTFHDDTPIKELLNLKLKKPKSWNWELSTSKSSSSINFPRIRLYDQHDNLLAEADESDQLVNNTTHPQHTQSNSKNPVKRIKAESFRHHQHEPSRSRSRSKTIDMSEFLEEIRQDMVDQGFKCKVSEGRRSSSRKRIDSGNAVDQSTLTPPAEPAKPIEDIQIIPQLITVFSERGLLQRDRNAKEFNKTDGSEVKATISTGSTVGIQRIRPKGNANSSKSSLPAVESISEIKPTTNFAMAKSKSAIDVPGKKKVYRRTHSTNSPSRFSSSILERFSVTKRRSSSTDSNASRIAENSNQVDGLSHDYKQPSYITRTCPAGTLIVSKDSFKTQRVRRRNVSTPRRSTTQEPDINQLLLPSPSLQSLAKSKSNTNTNYDKAIENIDNLISRAISSSSCHQPLLVLNNSTSSPSSVMHSKRSTKERPLSAAGEQPSPSTCNELTLRASVTQGRNHNLSAASNEICEQSNFRERRPRSRKTLADWQKKMELVNRDLIMEGPDKQSGKGRRRSVSADSERFRLMSFSSSSDEEKCNENMNEKQTAARSGWPKCRGRERTRRPATPLSNRRTTNDVDAMHQGRIQGRTLLLILNINYICTM